MLINTAFLCYQCNLQFTVLAHRYKVGPKRHLIVVENQTRREICSAVSSSCVRRRKDARQGPRQFSFFVTQEWAL